MDPQPALDLFKVVPPARNRVQLVQITSISVGLMNGGYIELLYGDYKPT